MSVNVDWPYCVSQRSAPVPRAACGHRKRWKTLTQSLAIVEAIARRKRTPIGWDREHGRLSISQAVQISQDRTPSMLTDLNRVWDPDKVNRGWARAWRRNRDLLYMYENVHFSACQPAGIVPTIPSVRSCHVVTTNTSDLWAVLQHFDHVQVCTDNSVRRGLWFVCSKGQTTREWPLHPWLKTSVLIVSLAVCSYCLAVCSFCLAFFAHPLAAVSDWPLVYKAAAVKSTDRYQVFPLPIPSPLSRLSL